MQTMAMRAHPLPIEGTLPSLAGATTWLTSPKTRSFSRNGGVTLSFAQAPGTQNGSYCCNRQCRRGSGR